MKLSRGLALWALLAGASCSYEKSDLVRPDTPDGAAADVAQTLDGPAGNTAEVYGTALDSSAQPHDTSTGDTAADFPQVSLSPDSNPVDVASSPESGVPILDGAVDVDRTTRMDGAAADASDSARPRDALSTF